MDPTRRPGWLLALGAFCLALFAVLALVVGAQDAPPLLDVDLLRFAVDHRVGWVSAFFRQITVLGSAVLLGPLVLIAAAWLLIRERRAWHALFVVAALIGANVLQNLAKSVVERPRPHPVFHLVDVGSFGYPSGHAAQALAAWVALAIVIAWGRSRATKVIALGAAGMLALVVGASRVVLGVHWTSDVLGGFALAGAWLCILAALLLRSNPAREVVEPGDTGRARANP